MKKILGIFVAISLLLLSAALLDYINIIDISTIIDWSTIREDLILMGAGGTVVITGAVKVAIAAITTLFDKSKDEINDLKKQNQDLKNDLNVVIEYLTIQAHSVVNSKIASEDQKQLVSNWLNNTDNTSILSNIIKETVSNNEDNIKDFVDDNIDVIINKVKDIL